MLVFLACTVQATCPEVYYRCGDWLGPYLPPARGDVATKEACMDACLSNNRCYGTVYSFSRTCYLIAGEDAFNFGNEISDAGISLVAKKPSGGQPGMCTVSTGATTCCETLYPRCGAIISGTQISSSTQSSLYNCVNVCYAEATCNSCSFDTQSGSCQLSSNTLMAGLYTIPTASSSMTEYITSRPSGSCFQVAQPGDCTAGCTGVTVSPRCGFVSLTLDQQNRLRYPPTTVDSVNTCLKMCGDRLHCKSIQYSDMTQQCQMYEYTSNELHYTDTFPFRSESQQDGPYVITDRPVTAEGNYSTCIPNFSPVICNGDQCPDGWTYRSSDSSCFLTYRGVSGLNFDAAQSLCKSTDPHSHLPVVTSAGENTFIAELVGSRKSTWVYAHEYHANPSMGFVTAWGVPIQFDNWFKDSYSGGCALLITSGMGKWIKSHCDDKHSNIVCQRYASELLITKAILQSTTGHGNVENNEIVVSQENVIKVTGHNLHTEVWLSLQTTTEYQHTESRNKATKCTHVGDLSGVGTPLRVAITSGVSSLQNETTATITIPRSWPLEVGASYSLCYADGRPYTSPVTPSQYQRYTGFDFIAVSEYHDRKKQLCDIRSGQRDAIHKQITDWSNNKG